MSRPHKRRDIIGLIRMQTSLIIAIITLITAPLAAWVAWLLTRKKTEAERQGAIASGAVDAVEAIKEVMESLHEQLEETKKELTEFKKQNKELEISLVQLKAQNEQLITQNKLLAEEVAELKIQMDRFSTTHDQSQNVIDSI